MKHNNISTTHAVGIGNGVSFDMIRRGAIEGGGEHIFIMDNKEMKKQVIQLLESTTSYSINDFKASYDTDLFENVYSLVPTVLK